jgi:DNA-binding MarR family transcriptional regulator
MPRRPAEGSSDVSRALERLLRLQSNRRVHARQSAAAGVVISNPGFAVLQALSEAGELSLGEVAKACSADPAAIGRQVKTLEDEGFVERSPSATDGRVSVVRLTEQGRYAHGQVRAVRTRHMTDVLAGWTEADRQTLAHLIDRLVDDMKATPLRAAGDHETTRRTA